MSGLDRWLQEAREVWQGLRLGLTRLVPPAVTAEDLDAGSPTRRWRALRALRHHPQPDLLPLLIQHLGDEDGMVRAAAEDVLVAWGPDRVLDAVRQALAGDVAPQQWAALLRVLARLPDASHRPLISPWLEDPDPEVRAAAWMALAALGADEDVPRLAQVLREGDPALQRGILATLCALGARGLAERAMAAQDPVLRQLGMQALARIEARATRPAAQTASPAPQR